MEIFPEISLATGGVTSSNTIANAPASANAVASSINV